MTPEQVAEFKHAKADAVVAPVKGQVIYEFGGDGEAEPTVEPYIGQEFAEGDTLCHILAPWGEFVEVKAAMGGKLVEVNAKRGTKVQKGDVLVYIERNAE
jgi:pyruvate carboxylase subunit B